MKEPARILSTKKLRPGQRQYLLNAGFLVTEADFIAVNPISFKSKKLSKNLIFTSQNGFKSFVKEVGKEGIADRNIFCVGKKNAEAIEKQGYRVTAFADYAEDLAALLIKQYSNEAFTFLSGSMRRNTLPQTLTEAGVEFSEIEVYTTKLTPHKINTAPNGILFFSPSGIKSYLKENSIQNEVCFCIGKTTAEALTGITTNIVTATRPSVDNVIIQCIKYYRDNNS